MISFYGGPQGVQGDIGIQGEKGENLLIKEIIEIKDSSPDNFTPSRDTKDFCIKDGNWLGVIFINNNDNNSFYLYGYDDDIEEMQWKNFYIGVTSSIQWEGETGEYIKISRNKDKGAEDESIEENELAFIFDLEQPAIKTKIGEEIKTINIPTKIENIESNLDNNTNYVTPSDLTLYQVGDLIVRAYEDQRYLINDNNNWVKMDGSSLIVTKQNNEELYNLIDNTTIVYPITSAVLAFPEFNDDNFSYSFVNYPKSLENWCYSEDGQQIYMSYSSTKDSGSTYDWFFIYDITKSGLKYKTGGQDYIKARSWDVTGGITGGYYSWEKDYDLPYLYIKNLLTNQQKSFYDKSFLDNDYVYCYAFQDWNNWFILRNGTVQRFYNFSSNTAKGAPSLLSTSEKTRIYKHYLIYYGSDSELTYGSYKFTDSSLRKTIKEMKFGEIHFFSYEDKDYLIGKTSSNSIYIYQINIDIFNDYEIKLVLVKSWEDNPPFETIESLYIYKDYIIINKYYINIKKFIDPQIKDILNQNDTVLLPNFSIKSFVSADRHLERFCGNSYSTFIDLDNNNTFDKTLVLTNPFQKQNLHTYLKIK